MKNKKLKANHSRTIKTIATEPLVIKRPALWLAVICFILYLPALDFGFTELDDTIFIRDLAAYNEDLNNLWISFQRGVFDAEKDTYYRPLFMDAMILNYQISGQEISGYRFVNILLHLLSVLLVFRLLVRLNIRQLTAFILTLLFAVHPVLTQAVVWIPGRNDTLMTVWVLSFLISAIDYTTNGKISSLVISFVCLLAAMFTKETALLAPAACLIVLLIILKNSRKQKSILILSGVWTVAYGVYFLARSMASLKTQGLEPAKMTGEAIHRLPVLVQYWGKIFLPFNLSVFPVQEDTSIFFGFAAVLLSAALLFLSKGKQKRMLAGGLLWFIFFLIPVLVVPDKLTEQTFEHRLYLPFIGVLMMLSQVRLPVKADRDRIALRVTMVMAGILCVLNFRHQQHFKDPLSFWQQAIRTSPNSAYAVMMYGARVEDKQEGYALMRRAYQLNPDQKYLNYYYGVMLQHQDSVLESEKHFLKEQEISDYYECDFYLAQVSYRKGDKTAAQGRLERYLSRDSMNKPANNNLLLLYLENKERTKALEHIQAMQRRGFTVTQNMIQQAQLLPR